MVLSTKPRWHHACQSHEELRPLSDVRNLCWSKVMNTPDGQTQYVHVWMEKTQKLLGHTNVHTTEIYADVVMETKVETINLVNGLFG